MEFPKKIILSPYSRGANNAKNYPYWQEVIDLLKKGICEEIIQIGVGNEQIFKSVTPFFFNGPLKDIEELVKKHRIFLSIDNFLQHLAYYVDPTIKGVVVWGPSDPSIFGYKSNVNLIKSRELLRPDQFGYYHQGYVWPHKDTGWVKPEEVANAVINLSA